MPPEIVALIDKPVLLAALLAIGAVCGMFAERLAERLSKAERRARWQRRSGKGDESGRPAFGRSRRIEPTPPLRSANDAADQLRIVLEAKFSSRPLLNKPERRLLSHLDRALQDEAPGWRAMGQVSLGEMLASDDEAAFFAINSKRVDLLIVDADCQPLHAIEFQGTGHHQGSAAARDAVKKEALRRAGIGYAEVVSGDTPADLRALVKKLAARSGLSPVRSVD